jgi:hypothetical protein
VAASGGISQLKEYVNEPQLTNVIPLDSMILISYKANGVTAWGMVGLEVHWSTGPGVQVNIMQQQI